MNQFAKCPRRPHRLAVLRAGIFGLVAVLPTTAASQDQDPRPGTEPAVEESIREAAPGPLRWEPADARNVPVAPRQVWILTPETALTGWAISGGKRREIRQTRIRIQAQTDGSPRDLGVIQHLANTEVAVLPPGDPRATAGMVAIDHPQHPWPNPAILGFYETAVPLDLNSNGRHEVVLTRTASVPEPGAHGLLLVEPGDDGTPRIVRPEDLVATIRFDEGALSEIRVDPEGGDPVLVGTFLPLYQCRFLARLGIRGESGCENCCLIPVFLRRDPADGWYRPFYDATEQRGLLDRLRRDLTTVSEGDPNESVSPVEQAALARAGAFFYLTGAPEARAELEKALGTRASDVRSQILLGKLERMFLQDTLGSSAP